ncbi:polymeric immunoglobulin receptor-like isoform X2 [Cebidichthys violaceus]|uniref:polymeric immunoglobulin receptor-like isoform X2 n=1 Tax=Cebidichthys violaceus TaxID=271503 RepID=UPI0035C96F8C
MNIHHVLFFCFFSALCGGNTAKVPMYTVAEGETASLTCHPSSSGTRKFFCKNECEADDILIKTDGNTAGSGKFSITYRNDSSGVVLTVIFTNLTKSDSGRYRCGLGKTLVPDSFSDFEVRVSDARQDGNSGFIFTETEGENITFGCVNTVYGKHKFFCKDKCKKDILVETDGNRTHSGRYSIEYIEGAIFGLYVTITQATTSDTGQYRCGYGRALSPDSFYDTSIIVIDAPTTFRTFPASASTPTTQSLSSSSGFPSSETTDQFTGSVLPLVVGVPLVCVLLAVFLLLLYKWKRRNLGLNTRGNADDVFMEAPAMYENIAPVSTCKDSTYQSLDPASRDQDQTYSTLAK